MQYFTFSRWWILSTEPLSYNFQIENFTQNSNQSNPTIQTNCIRMKFLLYISSNKIMNIDKLMHTRCIHCNSNSTLLSIYFKIVNLLTWSNAIPVFTAITSCYVINNYNVLSNKTSFEFASLYCKTAKQEICLIKRTMRPCGLFRIDVLYKPLKPYGLFTIGKMNTSLTPYGLFRTDRLNQAIFNGWIG